MMAVQMVLFDPSMAPADIEAFYFNKSFAPGARAAPNASFEIEFNASLEPDLDRLFVGVHSGAIFRSMPQGLVQWGPCAHPSRPPFREGAVSRCRPVLLQECRGT